MKHFSDYILERRSLNNVPILEDANGNIIAESRKNAKLKDFVS